jgi:hypothetical protein
MPVGYRGLRVLFEQRPEEALSGVEQACIGIE